MLGRYQPGDQITVDLDPDGKVLAITATEAKTPSKRLSGRRSRLDGPEQ